MAPQGAMPPAGEHKADDDMDQRTTEDGCQDRGWRSAQSHSDADLLCSLADDVGHHPVDAKREDHAAYIANWLDVLKADNRAIFTAATHAQRAADFINGLQPAASAG